MPKALDEPTLAKLALLDPTGQTRLVQRVMATYLKSLAKLRQQITAGLDQSDFSEVRLAAHTLKSSSASIGALQLAAVCAQVEHAIRDDLRDEQLSLVQQLQAEMDRVDEAVNRLIAEDPRT